MEQNPKILIVDDNEDLALTLTDIFELEGYEVLTAPNGAESLLQCEKRHFDMALIDIKLPDIEGLKLVSKFRSLRPDISCIIMSGHATLRSAAETVGKDGIVAFEIKPLDLDRLLFVIKQVISRKEIEKALKESERRYQTLIETVPDIIAELNADNKFVWLNKPGLEFFGPGALGKDSDEFSVTDTLKILEKEKISTSFNSGDIVGIEVLERRADGEERVLSWVIKLLHDAGGRITGALCTARDITDRITAEKTLRELSQKREELERIINRSPAVVFLWKSSTGWPVEFVSENVDQFGYAPEDFYSGRLPYADIIHPDDIKCVGAEVARYSAEPDRDSFTQEYRIITKLKQVRWVDDRTWMRRDTNGAITHFQGILMDITERKAFEERVRALSQKVISSQEEERARLSRSLHDELGQQLTAMAFEIEGLKLKHPAAEKKDFTRLSDALDRISAELRRICKGLRPTILDDLGLVAALKTLVREQSAVNFNIETSLLPVDEQEISSETGITVYRILQESLTNVIRHSGARNVFIGLSEKDSTLTLEIADDGKGFTEEALGSKKGLGLTGMRERAALCGGFLVIRSSLGNGTLVTLRVPAA